jgi:predicted porin
VGTNVFFVHSEDEGVTGKSVGNSVGAKRQFGRVVAKASYGKTDTSIKAYALGADYLLSNRTEVGVAYRNVDNVGTAHDVKQVAVGLTHRF